MDNNIKILLVEDHALIAHELEATLVEYGYSDIIVIYTYDDAIDAINNHNFDIALLDINLEESKSKSGIQLAIHLKEKQNIPFIFISALSDVATIKETAILKPNAYLVKPVNEATLFAQIQIAISNYQQNNVSSLTPEFAPVKSPFFYTKVGKKLLKILWSDVLLLEAGKNYITLTCRNIDYKIPLRSSIKKILDEMMPQEVATKFIRINRQVAVAQESIINHTKNHIETNFGIIKIGNI